MATNSKSASISAALIKGAYTSARSGGYQKSTFNLNFDGIAKALDAKAAANEKIKAEMADTLDFQPALGKIGEQDQGPLLDYFSGVKNQMADIHKQMQDADQETKIKLQGDLARLKQTAVTANESLTQRSQISEDFQESVKNNELTNGMDPQRLSHLKQIHVDQNYQLIIENGQTAYKLNDGTILTNKEANDFKLKAYDQQKTIHGMADSYFNQGSQNKPLTADAKDATRQSLMQGLNKDSINSLKTDKLLADKYDLVMDTAQEIEAINAQYGMNYKIGDELNPEHEKWGVANNIANHLETVHKSGMQEYEQKKAENKKDNLPRFAFGQKDNIRGANGMMYKYDPKQKGYVEQKFDGVAYDTTGVVIKDADEMNQFMVSPKFQLANI
jgi:hypothetical protein